MEQSLPKIVLLTEIILTIVVNLCYIKVTPVLKATVSTGPGPLSGLGL